MIGAGELGSVLGGVGAVAGGLAAWRTKAYNAERVGWERIVKVLRDENDALRAECRLLRGALRRAIQRQR